MAQKYRDRIAQSSGIGSQRAFESDFGKRILIKYGWQEGQGLGRLGNGRVACVQATRRESNVGLGVDKRKAEDDQWDNWWSDCFNNIAKRMNSKDSLESGSLSSASAAASDNDSSSSDSDDDDASKAAPGGGRITAVKKAGAMAGKLRRVMRQEMPKGSA